MSCHMYPSSCISISGLYAQYKTYLGTKMACCENSFFRFLFFSIRKSLFLVVKHLPINLPTKFGCVPFPFPLWKGIYSSPLLEQIINHFQGGKGSERSFSDYALVDSLPQEGHFCMMGSLCGYLAAVNEAISDNKWLCESWLLYFMVC